MPSHETGPASMARRDGGCTWNGFLGVETARRGAGLVGGHPLSERRTRPGAGVWETTKAPPGGGAFADSSQGRWGERGHQVCAELSAALASEGSSRTTGALNAWERAEGVRCVVLAWKVIVSCRSVGFDTRDCPSRRRLD